MIKSKMEFNYKKLRTRKRIKMRLTMKRGMKIFQRKERKVTRLNRMEITQW
jgi:hypothetical protein